MESVQRNTSDSYLLFSSGNYLLSDSGDSGEDSSESSDSSDGGDGGDGGDSALWAKSGGHAMELPIIVLKRIQRSFHIRKTPRGHVYSNINGVCAVYFVFFDLCSLLNILEMRKCARNERK